MLYYHYTNLQHAASIINDDKIIVSRFEKNNKHIYKKAACWFSTNPHFEVGQFAAYQDGDGQTVEIFDAEHMAKTIGAARFGFNKLKAFITYAKYKHDSKLGDNDWQHMNNTAQNIGADTTEWYASFQDIPLDLCQSVEIYLDDEWQEYDEKKFSKAIDYATILKRT